MPKAQRYMAWQHYDISFSLITLRVLHNILELDVLG